MMWRIALELLVTTVLMGLCVLLGYRLGYRKAYNTKLETALKNRRRRAALTPAEAEALGVVRPRVRRARVQGTSRRGLND